MPIKSAAEIFAYPNKYGYNLAINHPVIGAFYDDFFRRFKLPRKMGMGDPQRLKYEQLLWKYIRSIYRKYDPESAGKLSRIDEKTFLFTRTSNWLKEALHIFLTEKLDVSKEPDLFAQKYSKELIPLAEALKPSQTYLDWVNGDYDYYKKEPRSD